MVDVRWYTGLLFFVILNVNITSWIVRVYDGTKIKELQTKSANLEVRSKLTSKYFDYGPHTLSTLETLEYDEIISSHNATVIKEAEQTVKSADQTIADAQKRGQGAVKELA